ncbi:hypothetical protein BZA05DRAFT_395240 [Tricharina praecox]|uniref:uncharacterized protein n=1 Tax=Tricharina praecox TaxID=43433 RepID=UPI00221E6B55|nr:uncharacterized protein BZA05DRAFT_395240 [Tricharina praecox]KAI5853969.1 hypothetical protein BZA05DRAFT_395240 [Tricharina praecox]
MFPTGAGHQLDLNHLWQQVQELSAVLAANRESTVGLVKKADEIRHRGGDPADAAACLVNGNGTGSGSIPTPRELYLEEQNKMLQEEITQLRGENEDLGLLAQDYETVLEKVLEGLRIYAHEHSIATINIHSSYTNQLNNERAQNAALRQREIDNNARLTTLSQLLREAYQLETVLEPDIVIERLKAENVALRTALGVEEDPDCTEEVD